ncbi:hypothetical protein GGH94_002125 [Coemansia aciculifera]|uniref:Uncharacterized protein n=1 Tax=Coemansia aciculifera TaxID=417176 RepID=A0A9W8IT08_9FUNG|nr:hypothetical protein GGH94_002125 [Coemansia aciculifera]
MEAVEQVAAPPEKAIDRVLTLKVPLSTVGWNPDLMPGLLKLVGTVDTLTMHTSQFARHIILREVEDHPNSNPGYMLQQGTAHEIALDDMSDTDLAQLFALLGRPPPADIVELFDADDLAHLSEHLALDDPVPNVVLDSELNPLYDQLVAKYFHEYCMAADIEQDNYGTMSAIAAYVANDIVAAYTNNISQRFGNYLRATINKELRTKERAKVLDQDMRGQDRSAIFAAKRAQIWEPAAAVKRAITVRPIDRTGLDTEGLRVLDILAPVLDAYRPDYVFKNENIYYDIEARPESYFLAFIRLCQYFDRCAMADLVAREQAQTLARAAMEPRDLWARVVNLKSKPFCDREGLTFSGSVDTDGVSISITFRHPDSVHRHSYKPCYKADLAAPSATDSRTSKCPYITTLSPVQVHAVRKHLVFNDMGRGDLLYLMGWSSSVENPLVFRYTRQQRLDETRMCKFTKLREIVKNEHDDSIAIRRAELYLADFNHASLDPEEFLDYVSARSLVWEDLSNFYSNTMTKHTRSLHQVRFEEGHVRRDYPFHRKLRLSAFINQQQADARLKRNMVQKFGKRLVMVCGNWSAPMARFHSPIRGRGWRKKFKKFGFRTYLFDEFRTSKTCPSCHGDLANFKWIENPRPYQRWQRRQTLCHGLLQCSNCLVKQLDDEREIVYKPRLYNRNLAAVLNFRRITKYYIRTGKTPRVFWRPTRGVAAAADAPTAADAPIAAMTATATRARGAAAFAAPDVAESSSSAASASSSSMTLRSARSSDLTSGAQPPAKRSRNGSA